MTNVKVYYFSKGMDPKTGKHKIYYFCFKHAIDVAHGYRTDIETEVVADDYQDGVDRTCIRC